MSWPDISWRTAAWIATGLAVVVAAGAGLWLWSTLQERRALEAYAEVMTVMTTARAPDAPPAARAAVAGALEGFLARYPGSRRAGQAACELGNARSDARQWEAARGAYRIALAKGAQGTLRTLAQAGIAYTWEAERNFTRAGEAYRAALAGLKPSDFYYEQLLIDLGRSQEMAGQKDRAIATYQRLLKERPGSPRAGDVRGRLATLGAAS
ncbi:MAG: tetratricopeptide repeat protein [Candidatus Rokubacteria bacterium]|nr:tetratricopeptide repeat protein [Candidatus Rokubacteria bacterium]